MSTSVTEYHINIDGRTMTPVKMYQFAMGLIAGNNEERPPNLHHEFILAKRKIRKLERALRKAAGREKRLMQWIEYKQLQERLETWPMPPFAITNIPDDTRFTYGLPSGSPIPPASIEVTS